MPHPFQSSIDYLRWLVGRLPPKFPPELGRFMSIRVEEFARDARVTQEVIDRAAVEFGFYLWHYRKAFAEILAREGDAAIAQRFASALSADLNARVESESGGQPLEVARFPSFERAFTPEERLVIEEALLAARRAAAEDVRARIERGEIADYERTALRWKQERLRMEEQLLELRRLAREKPNLSGEILERVASFERGFVDIDREPTLDELTHEVENYRRME